MSEQIGCAVLAALPEAGGFSIVKIIVMLVLLPPWLYVATWVNKDTAKVHCPQGLWTGLILGAGLVGVIAWLLVPIYALGLLAYVLLAGGVGLSYVVTRNRRVVPEARVLTSQHLGGLFKSQKEHKVEVVTHLKFYDNLGRPVFAPPEEQPVEREAYNLAQNFIYDVVMFRASQVDVTVGGQSTTIRYVVDGVVQKRPSAPPQQAEAAIGYIKRLAGLDVEERRRPQEGKMSIEAGAVPLDVMVSSAGTTQGQRMLLKVVQEVARTKLEELGLPDDLRARLLELNAAKKGLILVSGPHGNGVTSTLYSLLRSHDAFMLQLGSLEARSAVDLENVTQVEYKDQADLPVRLAALLRRDPDVVMVDGCRTTRTATIICEAAGNISILLGMSAESSLQALAKWLKLAVDTRQEAVKRLLAITSQVLLRKLCPECREAYRPAKDLLAKLNLPAERIDRFFRPPTKQRTDEKGNPIICATCRGVGYYGRTAAFELLELNDEIRGLILENAPLTQIKAACRRSKMLYLQEQALRKVIEGVTSIEEVIRVSKSKGQ